MKLENYICGKTKTVQQTKRRGKCLLLSSVTNQISNWLNFTSGSPFLSSSDTHADTTLITSHVYFYFSRSIFCVLLLYLLGWLYLSYPLLFWTSKMLAHLRKTEKVRSYRKFNLKRIWLYSTTFCAFRAAAFIVWSILVLDYSLNPKFFQKFSLRIHCVKVWS